MNSSATDVLHRRMDRLLIEAVSLGASDLHVIVGVPPAFRVTGEILMADEDALGPEECEAMAQSLMTDLRS
ncbi:MAG: hypothetical protein RIS24_3479 [Verrucomicrobiota bacterium]